MTDFTGIDFTDVQGGQFDALPSGRYAVRVTDWSETETKNAGKLPAGTPGINWEFTVQEGEYEGRRLWTNHWLHPNTLGFLKSMLKATGKFTDDQLDGKLEWNGPDDVLDAELVVKVSKRNSEQYGEQNDIKGYYPAGSSTSAGAGGGGSSLMP
jgi:hypothetical protein